MPLRRRAGPQDLPLPPPGAQRHLHCTPIHRRRRRHAPRLRRLKSERRAAKMETSGTLGCCAVAGAQRDGEAARPRPGTTPVAAVNALQSSTREAG